jgi:biopolymer transport protein ExbD
MATKKTRRPDLEAKLDITSMMDIFTIILVFLLKSYSTESIAVQPSDQLQLPMSSAITMPEIAVKITITNCLEDQHNNPAVNCNALVVNDKAVVKWLVDTTYMDGDEKKATVGFPSGELKGQSIGGLADKLEAAAERAKKMGELTGQDDLGFKGRVLLLADQSLPFEVVRQVMYTAGQAQYGEFRFVVRKPG